jgi:hypothetical protein
MNLSFWWINISKCVSNGHRRVPDRDQDPEVIKLKWRKKYSQNCWSTTELTSTSSSICDATEENRKRWRFSPMCFAGEKTAKSPEGMACQQNSTWDWTYYFLSGPIQLFGSDPKGIEIVEPLELRQKRNGEFFLFLDFIQTDLCRLYPGHTDNTDLLSGLNSSFFVKPLLLSHLNSRQTHDPSSVLNSMWPSGTKKNSKTNHGIEPMTSRLECTPNHQAITTKLKGLQFTCLFVLCCRNTGIMLMDVVRRTWLPASILAGNSKTGFNYFPWPQVYT